MQVRLSAAALLALLAAAAPPGWAPPPRPGTDAPAPAGPAIRDRLQFQNGETLEGEILPKEGDAGRPLEHVFVRVASGEASFPRKQVAQARLDIPTRRATQDAAALLRISRVAEGLDAAASALEASEAAGEKEPGLAEAWERAGTLAERLGAWTRAADALERLSALRPADAALRERLAAARAKAGSEPKPPETGKRPTIDVPAPPPLPEPSRSPDDGLEVAEPWDFQAWDECDQGVYRIVPNPARTNRYLGIHWLLKPAKRKLIFGHVVPTTVSRVFRFDAFNASPAAIEIAFAADNGAGRYLESRPVTLPPNEWRTGLTFDFREKAFKSAKAGWFNFVDSYADGSRPQKIFIVIHPLSAVDGFLFIDALTSPPES